MSRRAVALGLAAAALTGCATEEWIYALDPRAITLPGVKRVDRPAFNPVHGAQGILGAGRGAALDQARRARIAAPRRAILQGVRR